ncbi:MAG: DOMON-like domain-containing protein [Phormidesmis sp.]
MTQTIPFNLRPFAISGPASNLTVSGQVTREKSVIAFSYLLAGDLDRVVIPPARETVRRADRLWEQTCFEFFLASGNVQTRTSPYWEFNLSPTGDWNVFSLAGYRHRSTETAAFQSLPFTVKALSDGLHLAVSVDVGALVEAGRSLQLGVSMVVIVRGEEGAPEETFWAIAHPAAQADFHHPDSFAIKLAPE